MTDSMGISQPFPIFFEKSGQSLDAGYVYIGEANKNPEAYPVQVYWDADLTLPAPQPLRTIGGYYSNNGTPAKVFVNGTSCSITVRNKSGSLVWTDLNSIKGQFVTGGLDSSLVVYGSLNQKNINDGLESIADMLAIVNPTTGMRVDVKSYFSGLGYGGGEFVYDSTSTDTPNGGTIIASNHGGNWLRQGIVNYNWRFSWFGVVANDSSTTVITANSAKMNAAMQALSSTGGGNLWCDVGTTYIKSRLQWTDNVFIYGNKDLCTIQQISVDKDDAIIVSGTANDQAKRTNFGAYGVIFDANCSVSPLTNAVSAIGIENSSGFRFVDCTVKNASGYGIAAQYRADTRIPNNAYITDVLFKNSKFLYNGIGAPNNTAGQTIAGDTYDGADFKNVKGLTVVDCEFAYNYDKGLDIRGEDVYIIGNNNFHHNQGNGLGFYTAGDGTNNSYGLIQGGHAYSNGLDKDKTTPLGLPSDGVIIGHYANTANTNYGHIDIIHLKSTDNRGGGVNTQSSNKNFKYSISKVTSFGNGTFGFSITGSSSYGDTVIEDCLAHNNGTSGLILSGNNVTIRGGRYRNNANYGIQVAGGTNNALEGHIQVHNNTSGQIDLASVTLSTLKVDPVVRDYVMGTNDSIASAATITLPVGGRSFYITGTEVISTITPLVKDREVTLIFRGTTNNLADLAHGTGNLILAASSTFAPNSDFSNITLVCVGSYWVEKARMIRGSS